MVLRIFGISEGQEEADNGEDQQREQSVVQPGDVGDFADERDEEKASHAPGKAHQEGRDRASLTRGELLTHDDVDWDCEEEHEATESEAGDREPAAGEEETREEGNTQDHRDEDGCAAAEAIGNVATDEAPQGTACEVEAECLTGMRDAETTLASEVERQELREGDLNNGADEDEEIEDGEGLPDGLERFDIEGFFSPGFACGQGWQIREQKDRSDHAGDAAVPALFETEAFYNPGEISGAECIAERAGADEDRHPEGLVVLDALRGAGTRLRVEARNAKTSEYSDGHDHAVAGSEADHRDAYTGDCRCKCGEKLAVEFVRKVAETGLSDRVGEYVNTSEEAGLSEVEAKLCSKMRLECGKGRRVDINEEMPNAKQDEREKNAAISSGQIWLRNGYRITAKAHEGILKV